ncbi:GWxTD domain-containing protein [candidate division KSB1 bacterium]|nr:GWxTD domain-containing protein [candidate division KSB1 bacterium]
MKPKFFIEFLCILIILCCLKICTANDEREHDRALYQTGRKYCLAQNWDDALSLFQQLISEYPDSRYCAGSHFWIGYCLEKKNGFENEAFNAFDYLTKKFPESSWADDAVVHQISLAEKFARAGKQSYISFLIAHLGASNASISQQAAIALGFLGHRAALPILKEMTNDPYLASVAQSLIKHVEETGQRKPSTQDGIEKPTRNFSTEDVNSDDLATEPGTFPFIETQRHEQYRKLLKTGQRWSKDELVTFAIWHILPTDRFEQFNSLHGDDRREWLRKYWKLRDPTPTTTINESYLEFERRLAYAHKHFSRAWGSSRSMLQKEQYQLPGKPNAPWDARGEVYIKYGEPDFIAHGGVHKEEWTYYKYNVDFIITQYMTNIFGNAVFPGPISDLTKSYDVDYDLAGEPFSARLDATSEYTHNRIYHDLNFIFKPEFRYHHDYKAKPIQQFKFAIRCQEAGSNRQLIVEYELPIDEFQIISTNERCMISYSQRYVVFDSQLNEVIRDECQQQITADNKKSIRAKQKIQASIPITLAPGRYKIALRIEYQKSNKLGIYQKDFVVED